MLTENKSADQICLTLEIFPATEIGAKGVSGKAFHFLRLTRRSSYFIQILERRQFVQATKKLVIFLRSCFALLARLPVVCIPIACLLFSFTRVFRLLNWPQNLRTSVILWSKGIDLRCWSPWQSTYCYGFWNIWVAWVNFKRMLLRRGTGFLWSVSRRNTCPKGSC